MPKKKLAALAAVALLSLASAAAAQDKSVRNGMTTKLGLDLAGPLDAVVAGTPRAADARGAYSMALEHVWGGPRTVSFGLGLLSQAPRRIVAPWARGSLGFVAGYGVANVALPLQTPGFGTYASFRLGWSFPMADRVFKSSLGAGTSLSPDLYWGAAAGVVIGRHLLFEAGFSALHGEAKWTNRSADEIECRQVTLSIGLQF